MDESGELDVSKRQRVLERVGDDQFAFESVDAEEEQRSSGNSGESNCEVGDGGVGRSRVAENETRRSRKYCWVLNNYSADDESIIKSLYDRECGGISYLVFQREVGDKGTSHLQGFVNFKSARTFGATIRFFSSALGHRRLHLEIARGSPEQNRDYCTKDSTRAEGADSGPFEFGDRPTGQGKRTDILAVGESLRAGRNWADVAITNTDVFIKFSTGIMRASALFSKPRTTKPIVKWFYGRTGKGKSLTASKEAGEFIESHRAEISRGVGADCEEHPVFRPYWKNGSSSWWDGYCGQRVVIIDDYRKDMCKFSELLRLLDYYPYQVEVKGAFVNFVAELVIFTTPKSPVQTWDGRTEEDLDQLCRRIDIVTHFDSL